MQKVDSLEVLCRFMADFILYKPGSSSKNQEEILHVCCRVLSALHNTFSFQYRCLKWTIPMAVYGGFNKTAFHWHSIATFTFLHFMSRRLFKGQKYTIYVSIAIYINEHVLLEVCVDFRQENCSMRQFCLMSSGTLTSSKLSTGKITDGNMTTNMPISAT